MQLVHRPPLARPGIAVHGLRRERIEQAVVSRVHGHELPLQVRGQLGQFDAVLGEPAPDVVTVRPALGSLLEVEQAGIPARHLYAGEAEARCPLRHFVQRVERGLVAGELGQEYGRAAHRSHVDPPGRLAAPSQRGNRCRRTESPWLNGRNRIIAPCTFPSRGVAVKLGLFKSPH